MARYSELLVVTICSAVLLLSPHVVVAQNHTLRISSTVLASPKPGDIPPEGQGGEVTSPGEGSFSYPHGTHVPLEAMPYEGCGFRFPWWGPSIETGIFQSLTSGDYSVYMNQDHAFTVTFFGPGVLLVPPLTWALDVSSGEGGYTDPPEAHYTGIVYSVWAKAVPAAGYQFTGWTGSSVDAGIVGDFNSAEIPVWQPLASSYPERTYTLRANFEPTSAYTLAIDVTPPGSGSVTRAPHQATYLAGQEVVLTAQTSAGYRFKNWAGSIWSTSNPITVDVISDMTIRAVFEEEADGITIAGCICTDDASPVSSVSLLATNGADSVTAGPSGQYSLTVPRGWSGTIRASLNGYSFSPTSRLYNNVMSDMSGEDYIASPVTSCSIYVDDTAHGTSDGTSWINAYRYLQDALRVAPSGSEVRIAQGIYRPDQDSAHPQGTGDCTASFQLKNSVTVRGGYAGSGEPDPDRRDPATFASILSGDLNDDDRVIIGDPALLLTDRSRADNSCHVVISSDTDSTATLDGVTIMGGNAADAPDGYSGGGLLILDSSATIDNCVFLLNSSGSGGGAVANVVADPTFKKCTFVWNAGIEGAGMYNRDSSPLVVNCLFAGNVALAFGGGMYNQYYHHTTSPQLVNCFFSYNRANERGGAIRNSGACTPTVSNCTVCGNSGTEGAGLSNDDVCWLQLANSILWGNGNEAGHDESAQISGGLLTVDYCCIQGWTGNLGGTGNHGSDPMLVDPVGVDGIGGTEDDNPRLRAGSPCIDAGKNSLVPLDAADLDEDGDFSENLPLDFDGNRRLVDDPKTTDIGSGAWPIIDIGACEKFLSPSGEIKDLVVGLLGTCITLESDPSTSRSSSVLIGSASVELELNSRAMLSVEVTVASAAGGTWTGWVVPEGVIGPGSVTVTIWVRGENLDLSALHPVDTSVQVADVSLFLTPWF